MTFSCICLCVVFFLFFFFGGLIFLCCCFTNLSKPIHDVCYLSFHGGKGGGGVLLPRIPILIIVRNDNLQLQVNNDFGHCVFTILSHDISGDYVSVFRLNQKDCLFCIVYI